MFFLPSVLMSQKTITPVESDDEKPRQPTLHYYDKHGDPLDEPVLFLAELDTVTKVKAGPVYPLLYSASVGLNIFDGVMMIAGQKHASIDISGSLSLHNWIEPTIECGLGFANNRPEQGNFHYKNNPSFYAKLGANYNFLYKSNPDYQVFLGLRFGFTHFKYNIDDITISTDYWDQSNHFSLSNQTATSFYGQVLGGIKVKIWRDFSMGWTFRYGFMMKSPKAAESTPWFVPGYGTGPLSATFSLIYNFPINTKRRDSLSSLKENSGPNIPPPTGSGVAVPQSKMTNEPLIEPVE